MTYSKGKWRYDAESGAVYTTDRTGYWGPDHYPVEVCVINPLDGISNGPLIAAAPELLEALQKLCVIQEYGDVASWASEWVDARAAIAKATGESK